jgi:L-asparaginase II
MSNPVIAEVCRGPLVESIHHGAFVVMDRAQKIIAQAGDIHRPVFPRSAIKAFQCLPLLESGGAAAFSLTDEDIALCCSSHNGEAAHVRIAASILGKCSCGEEHYECGAHWPTAREASNALLLAQQRPRAIHNNCSGKHAGMIAFAQHMGFNTKDYVKPDHPVQRAMMNAIGNICDVDLSSAPMGIDGCSVPSWAFGLRNMARGFARLTAPNHTAGLRIIAATRAHPFLVAGSGRFDTKIMTAVPRLFIKVGAEGVFCGAIAHAGLGFALKCDDGASRGAEVAIAGALSKLDVWTDDERASLKACAIEQQRNWRGIEVGETRSTL